jgi:hypothetical protein
MRKTLLLSIWITILTMGQAWGATRYVDDSVTSSGAGTSWATAFKTIQEGIDASSDGDTVIVAEGTYFENIEFKGKNIVLTSTEPNDPGVVQKTIIDGNDAGSAVAFDGTENETCVLSGFTIRNGNAEWGGGISGGTDPAATYATIQNNTITANSAEHGGGLALCDGTIQNNTITGNWGNYGGGLNFCWGTIQNNTIAGNSAGAEGGGLDWCVGTIQNNTIVGNSAQYSGGGLAWCGATSIQNCIVRGNTALDGPQLRYSSPPTYSCIEGWTQHGEGNMALDPKFVDPDGPDNDPGTLEDNDYRLSAGSPCIDAGKNENWMADAVDLDGNPRIVNGTVDMGAYEYGSSSPFRITQLLMTGGFQLTWASRPGDQYVVWSCTDLASGAWTQGQTVPSAGDSTSWTDASPSGARKFYRVELK